MVKGLEREKVTASDGTAGNGDIRVENVHYCRVNKVQKGHWQL